MIEKKQLNNLFHLFIYLSIYLFIYYLFLLSNFLSFIYLFIYSLGVRDLMLGLVEVLMSHFDSVFLMTVRQTYLVKVLGLITIIFFFNGLNFIFYFYFLFFIFYFFLGFCFFGADIRNYF